MKPLPDIPRPAVTFTGRLHDARTATAIGRLLGVAVLVCFLTGLISHYVQRPPDWLVDVLPSRPTWGYRVTQGLHVASGIAAVPLLLAKLWTVYPRLFVRPALRSVLRHGLERLSVAVLVAASLFELLTGLLNTAQWYPWPFSFVPVHYAVAWLLAGALLLHLAVKWPDIRDHWGRRSPGTVRLDPADAPDRRSLLTGVAVAVGAVTVTTVGQSFTPLKALDLLAPRHPDHGSQGLPVNRTAAAAGTAEVPVDDWRLTVMGPRPRPGPAPCHPHRRGRPDAGRPSGAPGAAPHLTPLGPSPGLPPQLAAPPRRSGRGRGGARGGKGGRTGGTAAARR